MEGGPNKIIKPLCDFILQAKICQILNLVSESKMELSVAIYIKEENDEAM